MKPMSQEELDELKRRIGIPKPIEKPPQIKDEDMPTIQEMVRAMKFTDEDNEGDDNEDEDNEKDRRV